MHSNKRIVNSALASIMLFAWAGNAGAALVITSLGSVSGGGLALASSNSDSYTMSTLSYTETFGPSLSEGEASFNVATGGSYSGPPDSGGLPEYAVTLNVTNTSPQTWTDYQVYCGADNIPFPVYTSEFVFDTSPTPTATVNGGGSSVGTFNFNESNSAPANGIVWNDLNVPNGDTLTLTFGFDMPGSGSGQWQIQQQPSVPEPCSMAILAPAFVGLMGRRGRRPRLQKLRPESSI